ncbi:MAG: long-chain fatty acid--CoA ligase [Deltaproteobacteria bacterium]|nr:long-chain fatty acid--CoA ligase [Deltaproteobacteria bacterium]
MIGRVLCHGVDEITVNTTFVQYTLPQILLQQSETLGVERIAIREKAYGIWQQYTWREYLQYVKHAGLGLKSIGLKRGEFVGIVTNNLPEWLFTELGSLAVGGITVNLFTSSVREELTNALNRIRASYVIAQDQEQVDKLLDARGSLSHVRRVIYIDATGMSNYKNNPWLLSFVELMACGEGLASEKPELFHEEVQRGKRDNVAIMIQTSGTTGVSKLAMLSHRNITEMAAKWNEVLLNVPGGNWISISPPAWIVDQMWGVGVALLGGMTMNFPETPETIVQDFREIGPSVIITSSRFWEDLASQIMVKMADAGFVNRFLFARAVDIGKKVVKLKSEKKDVPVVLKLLHHIANLLIYRPLRDRIGCSGFHSAFTGGHPISPDVIHFFRAVGLNLKQCYGLTETGGIFQVQPDEEVKLETVGKPLPRTRVKISEDQEVLVRSESNFMGYFNDFKATEEAFNDGWLKTGDAGYIDTDGHLVIIGRRGDIIKNKEGHAFSPDFIETRLKFSPYIKEAVIFGEARPYITALINIDMGNVGNWAEDRMIAYTTYTDLSQQQAVRELILEELRKVNEILPDIMKVRKFILLHKLLDADDEELTRTGKVRRRFVYGLYIKLIEAMYQGLEKVNVKSKVQYRDGQIGEIETTVRINTVA